MAYRIKELREKNRISQERLAELSGISRGTIAILERNSSSDVKAGTLKSLAKALNVSVSELFDDEVKESVNENEKEITVGALRTLAKALNVTPGEIFD